jgi:hypothetical protein
MSDTWTAAGIFFAFLAAGRLWTNGSLVEAIAPGPKTAIRINARNEANKLAAFGLRTSTLPLAPDAGAE